MKIYRCVLGILMVFFIIVGVWYVVSCYDEQRSTKDGTLIYEQIEDTGVEMRGEEPNGTDYDLYQG